MSVETHQILTGSRGWIHESWQKEYYPEDLPEDWQLGFYSNEFPVVLVPAEYWDNVDEETLEGWCEDISETFSFLFEVPSTVVADEKKLNALIEQVKSFESHCLGVILNINAELLEDINTLENVIQMVKKITRVCVQLSVGEENDSLLQLLEKEDVSVCWDGNSDLKTDTYLRGNLSVTLAQSEKMDPANLRHVLEAGLQASTSDRIAVLIINGNPPSLDVMRNAEVILGLL